MKSHGSLLVVLTRISTSWPWSARTLPSASAAAGQPQPFAGEMRHVDQVRPAVDCGLTGFRRRMVPQVRRDVHVRVAGPDLVERANPRPRRRRRRGGPGRPCPRIPARPPATDGRMPKTRAAKSPRVRTSAGRPTRPMPSSGRPFAAGVSGCDVLQPQRVRQHVGNACRRRSHRWCGRSAAPVPDSIRRWTARPLAVFAATESRP